MNRSRRALLAGLAAAPWLAACGSRPVSRKPARARVIVVGGGFAGAACARTLARFGPELAVTLVEPRRDFLTGPMCNAMLAGLVAQADVTQGPAALERAGVRLVDEVVTQVDPIRLRVRLASGTWLDAERIVVAPGIALRWDAIEGVDATTTDLVPHGWLGDASLLALKRQWSALRDGATVAIVAPPNPYRCPPGPYERASLLAWWLTQRYRRGKVLVCDGKDDFSKRALFQTGWDVRWPGVVEWRPRAEGGEVVGVDARRRELHLAGGERFVADLVCAIPPQQAAAIAHAADLVDESGWCPVRAGDFRSARHAGIHVIGDAAIAHPMPKSATAANAQAKLCALAILAELRGEPMPPARLVNTCYSLVAPDYGISVGGLYGAVEGRLSALSEGTSPLAADAALRAAEAAQAHEWYRGIVVDSFGV